MGDTRGVPSGGTLGGGVPGGGVPGGGVPSGGAPNRAQPSMESLLGALATLMEQQRRQSVGGYGSTKALKGVVDKIGRFDGNFKLWIEYSVQFEYLLNLVYIQFIIRHINWESLNLCTKRCLQLVIDVGVNF